MAVRSIFRSTPDGFDVKAPRDRKLVAADLLKSGSVPHEGPLNAAIDHFGRWLDDNGKEPSRRQAAAFLAKFPHYREITILARKRAD